MKHQKSSGLFGALLKKEFQRFTGSATYMLNCGLGVVLLLRADRRLLFHRRRHSGGDHRFDYRAAHLLLRRHDDAVHLHAGDDDLGFGHAGGTRALVLKTAPVPTTTILAAKTAVNLILYLPTLLIAAILLSIRFSLGVQYALFLFLIPAAALVITTALGLILNLCFPKLDYDNETRAIKQSMSVFLSTMINMLLTILFSVPLYVLLVPYSQFFSAGLRLRPCPPPSAPALLCPAKLGREEIQQLAGIDVLSADYGKFFRKFAITYCNLRRDGV